MEVFFKLKTMGKIIGIYPFSGAEIVEKIRNFIPNPIRDAPGRSPDDFFRIELLSSLTSLQGPEKRMRQNLKME